MKGLEKGLDEKFESFGFLCFSLLFYFGDEGYVHSRNCMFLITKSLLRFIKCIFGFGRFWACVANCYGMSVNFLGSIFSPLRVPLGERKKTLPNGVSSQESFPMKS